MTLHNILKLKALETYWVGYTDNFKKRSKEHREGKVLSTMSRRRLELVYYAVCLNQYDVLNREKYLKTAWGERYKKNRIKYYLTG